MGFTIERFSGNVSSMFLCPWCGHILENPKMVELDQCEHIFCDTCLLGSRDPSEAENESYTCPIDSTVFRYKNLRTPVKFFMNLYSKLNIYCQFRENNCQKIVPILEVIKHEQECKMDPANYIACEKICMLKVHKDDLESHRCGDYFMSILNVLTDRLTKAEDELVILKEEYSEEKEALGHQIAELKKENQLLAKRNQDLSNTNNTLPVNSSTASNWTWNSSSSTSQQHSASRRKKVCPPCLLLPNLVDVFMVTVAKYSQLTATDFHERIASEKWHQSSLCQVMDRIATELSIKHLIKNYNLAHYVHEYSYKQIIACQRNVESVNLIFSLSALQYLSPHLSRDKGVVIISQEGHCLVPYFAHLSKSVILFGSNQTVAFYGGKIKWEHNIYNKVKHSFYMNEAHLVELLTKQMEYYPQFSNLSIIVSFENLSRETYIQLLKLAAPTAFLLIMNPQEGFQKAHLNVNGDFSAEILADAQSILCDDFF